MAKDGYTRKEIDEIIEKFGLNSQELKAITLPKTFNWKKAQIIGIQDPYELEKQGNYLLFEKGIDEVKYGVSLNPDFGKNPKLIEDYMGIDDEGYYQLLYIYERTPKTIKETERFTNYPFAKGGETDYSKKIKVGDEVIWKEKDYVVEYIPGKTGQVHLKPKNPKLKRIVKLSGYQIGALKNKSGEYYEQELEEWRKKGSPKYKRNETYWAERKGTGFEGEDETGLLTPMDDYAKGGETDLYSPEEIEKYKIGTKYEKYTIGSPKYIESKRKKGKSIMSFKVAREINKLSQQAFRKDYNELDETQQWEIDEEHAVGERKRLGLIDLIGARNERELEEWRKKGSPKYAKGGLTEGKSHKDGGIPMTVKSTGQNIEVEGGEGIINKRSMSDSEKHTFDGKQMSNCEIVSAINTQNNQGVSMDCDTIEGRKYLLGGGVHPLPPETHAKGGEVLEEIYDEDYDTYKLERKRKHLANGGVIMREIFTPEQSLGIPRKDMPQISTIHLPDFMEELDEDGIDYENDNVLASGLTPTQSEINLYKVNRITEEFANKKPMLVSKDGYVIDGHHRWYWFVQRGLNAPIIRVDLNARQLLDKMHDFEFVKYKQLKSGGLLPNPNQLDLFAGGGKIEANKYHTGIIPKDIYSSIFEDRDDDGIPNPDDLEPNKPSDTRVEEVSLADEMDTIIDYRNKFDVIREDFVEKLTEISSTCGETECSVLSRTKTPYSIINKLRRRSLTGTKELGKLDKKAEEKLKEKDLSGIDLYKGLTDIVGTMVVAPDKKTLDKVRKVLKSGKLGKVLEEEDFYAEDKGGYTAYHFLIGIKDFDIDNPTKTKIYPIEVQAKTQRVKKLGDAVHTIYKQGKLNEGAMRKIGKQIEKADKGDKKAINEVDTILDNPKDLEKALTKEKKGEGGSTYADGGGVYSFKKGDKIKLKPSVALKSYQDRGISNPTFIFIKYSKKSNEKEYSHIVAIRGGEYEDILIEDAIPYYADGGEIGKHKLQLYNQYANKSPETVWNIWTPEQRKHFISDHHMKLVGNKGYGALYKRINSLDDGVNWNSLPEFFKYVVHTHIVSGSYYHGGSPKSSGVSDSVALSYLPTYERKSVMGNDPETQKVQLENVKKALTDIPKLYSQDGKGKNAIVYLHYFNATGSDWYITELDKKTNEGFGYAVLNGDSQMSEFGYIPLNELINMDIGIRSPELDLYWDYKTLNQAFQESYPELVKSPVEIYKEEGTETPKKESDNWDAKIKANEFKNPYERNVAIEQMIEQKGEDGNNYTVAEKEFLMTYSGMGGLGKHGATGKGLLYEYYTPMKVAKFMWSLAVKHQQIGINNVLENSVGIGVFAGSCPTTVKQFYGIDISKVAVSICNILYSTNYELGEMPKETQFGFDEMYFEQFFIKNNDTVKGKVEPLYDLVIGNCPYGKFSGRYSAMGEKQYTNASSYVEYFITRSLDLLKTNGLLIYIIGTPISVGGTPFLDTPPTTKVLKDIRAKSDLIDAYRLGSNIFATTDIDSDIIVLKKK